MTILLSELAQGFEKLTCVARNSTVQEALDIMLSKQFTQLPIIDDDGKLIGAVSDRSIVQTLYDRRKSYSELAKLAVRNCLDPGAKTTLTPQDDIFAAMERLESAPFVIVVNAAHVPVGIVTSYDTGQVLSAIGEVLVRARDIEARLREYIERAYPTPETRSGAVKNAFGANTTKNTDRLTFGDLIDIIVNRTNWHESFDKVLGPQDLFRHHIECARDIRNDIAHFRRKVVRGQDIPIMIRSLDWLLACERLPLSLKTEARAVFVIDSASASDEVSTGSSSVPNYAALENWLVQQLDVNVLDSQSIVVRFEDMEQLLEAPLPQAALEHLSWWANDIQQPQANAWMSARVRVSDIDLLSKQVTFTLLPMSEDDFEILAMHNSEEW